jgi:ribosome biogenesis GTPase
MFRRGASVRIDGADRPCSVAKTFRATPGSTPLTVGDEVTVALTAPHTRGDRTLDKDRADGVILARAERRTALGRPQPTSGKRRGRYDEAAFLKVVAANMDALVIVASVREPPLRPGLIDRFCIAAERGDLAAVVVLNKIDLCPGAPPPVEELVAGEVTVLACSAVRGDGLAELGEALRGRRSVLAGASGVGKSTLVNALVPGAELATRSVRARDQRGRHVTASTTVHELPGGGLIVDTPGVRELAVEMEPSEVPWYFPDFAEVASACRFGNCTHTHEPHCAVRRAVEDGRIAPGRYRRYLRILETI